MIHDKHIFPALALFMALLMPCASIAQSQRNGDMLPPPMETANKAETGNQTQMVPTVEYVSESEMDEVFSQARQRLQGRPEMEKSPQRSGVNEEPPSDPVTQQNVVAPVSGSQSDAQPQYGGRHVPLREVTLRIAYQNLTIEEIMQKVAEEINQQSGDWQVQWRLSETNRDIIEQRVNINAESNFDEFLSHLTAKINNLTGVRLFIKVFEVSRVIIIADTF